MPLLLLFFCSSLALCALPRSNDPAFVRRAAPHVRGTAQGSKSAGRSTGTMPPSLPVPYTGSPSALGRHSLLQNRQAALPVRGPPLPPSVRGTAQDFKSDPCLWSRPVGYSASPRVCLQRRCPTVLLLLNCSKPSNEAAPASLRTRQSSC